MVKSWQSVGIWWMRVGEGVFVFVCVGYDCCGHSIHTPQLYTTPIMYQPLGATHTDEAFCSWRPSCIRPCDIRAGIGVLSMTKLSATRRQPPIPGVTRRHVVQTTDRHGLSCTTLQARRHSIVYTQNTSCKLSDVIRRRIEHAVTMQNDR